MPWGVRVLFAGTAVVFVAMLAQAIFFPARWVIFAPGPRCAVLAMLANLGDATREFQFEQRRLPTSLDELVRTPGRQGEPYLRTLPLDPWGHSIRYLVADSTRFELRSDGEDGEPGTDDDEVWPPNDVRGR